MWAPPFTVQVDNFKAWALPFTLEVDDFKAWVPTLKQMFDGFNPKRHGLFGQLNTWGGGGLIQSILEKRSVTPPNFILEQQTVSHMKAEVFS